MRELRARGEVERGTEERGPTNSHPTTTVGHMTQFISIPASRPNQVPTTQ